MSIDLKEKKKEIIVVSIYVIIFAILLFIINNLNNKKTDIKSVEELTYIKYNQAKQADASEEELISKSELVTWEIEIAKAKLPNDLDETIVIDELTKMRKYIGLSDYRISSAESNENFKYIKVDVNSISGTFEQLKNFLKYIEEADIKVSVSNLNVTVNNNYVTGNMDLNFYGKV